MKASAMLISLHEHFKIRLTDWLLSAILFSWGMALFAVNPQVWTLPPFSGLRAWESSQVVWASAATGIGAVRLALLFINGALRRSPHLRAIGAFLSVFVWVQLSFGIMFGDVIGPGIAIFPWLALTDVFNVYRAMGDARCSDDRARARHPVAARAGRA